MSKYKQSQIDAVREQQRLHGVPGFLSDEACEEYLDWYLLTCTAEARGIGSLSEAKEFGLKEGLTMHELQFRKLSELVR